MSLTVNSLTTVGYLQEVFIKLWIPSMVRIFTSAWIGNLSQGFIRPFQFDVLFHEYADSIFCQNL